MLINEKISIGSTVLDCGAQVLHTQGQEIRLSAKLVEVLRLLAAHPGETLPRSLIIEKIWNGNHYVGHRGLTNVIWQLRRHLEPGAITTVAKSGYRLELPVTPLTSPGAATVAPLLWRIRRRAKSLFLVLSAGLVVIGGWQVVTRMNVVQAPPFDAATSLTYFNGVEEYPAYSRAGDRLAFTWEKENEGSRIMIRDLADPSAALHQVSLSADSEVSPTWGPGDNELAFARVHRDGSCTVVIRTLETLNERIIDSCIHERYHRVMEWSADGRYLFYTGRAQAGGAVAIMRHDLATGETRRVTRPGAGEEDNQLAASPDGHRLAFVRTAGAAADVYVLAEDGKVTRITHRHEAVYGLAWQDDQRLVMNVLRNGSFNLWQLDLADGTFTLAYQAETPFNIAARRDGSNRIAFSLHRSIEYLELLDPLTGAQRATLSSTGRDLYGDYASDRDKLAFLSTRSGRFEIWTSAADGNVLRVQTHGGGLPSFPRWMPGGEQLAYSVLDDHGRSRIMVLDTATDSVRWQSDDTANYRNLSWIDSGNLLVSSDRGGEWNLWSLSLSDQNWTQLTADGGQFGEVHDGLLYYTRFEANGLWRRKLGGGIAELIVADLALDDWASWGISADTLYYVLRQPDADEIWRQPLAGGEAARLLSYPRNSIRIYRGLSVASGGELVITRLGNREADIIELGFSAEMP